MSQPPPQFVGPADDPNRYELVVRHAVGGEGEVWKAREYHGGEPFYYALKIIHVQDGEDASVRLEELRMQAALAIQIEHPTVVKIKEVFVGPPPEARPNGHQCLYFVMKWIEGRSLQDALEDGTIRGVQALTVLESIAEAIDYLHSGRDTHGAPVLHRDIKPANILISADGRVYLVDFGLVRLRSTDQTSRFYGTAPFMAPESVGRGEYTPARDRYTLGATTFYALTGKMPVAGDQEDMATRLRAALGPGSDRIVRGILNMLAPQPDRRPSSAVSWIRALRAAPGETTRIITGPASPGQLAGARQNQPPAPGQQVGHGQLSGQAPPAGQARRIASALGGLPAQHPGYPPIGPVGATGYPPRSGQIPTGYGTPGRSQVPRQMPGPVTQPPRPGYGPTSYGRPRQLARLPYWLLAGVVVLLVLVLCSWQMDFFSGGSDSNSSSDPSPTHSIDRASPPPLVGELEPVLVAVGDLITVFKVDQEDVSSGETGLLRGGLSQLKICETQTPTTEALGTHTENGFIANLASPIRVASSVAGFYGGYSPEYFAEAKAHASSCGMQTFNVGRLGDDAFGVFQLTAQSDEATAMVFVRSGRVVLQLALIAPRDRTTYQTEATRLASRMASRMSKDAS